MPPRRKIETTTTPDEAQAESVDEIQHVDAAPTEPAVGPTAPSGATALNATAASMAGILGDLKATVERLNALEKGHNISVELREELEEKLEGLGRRLDASERAAEIDAVTTAARVGELLEQLTKFDRSMDTIVLGLNDRLSILETSSSRSAVPVRAIYPAMWEVMKEVQGVGKHGLMAPEGGGYQFRKYDDLKRELGAACRRHGVGLQSKTLSRERHVVGRMNYVLVEMRYRFTSLVDGSEMVFEAYGEGSSTTDKATGKAMTGALKSTMDQAFMLAAEDIEDPDATNEEPERFVNTRGPNEGRPIEPTREYKVGDKVAVAGQTFVKHSDGPALGDSGGPSYPNNTPKSQADPWDQGPPKDERTPEQKAQAAADKLSKPNLTMDEWSKITEYARQLEIMDTTVATPDGARMELKRYAVAVARTLP